MAEYDRDASTADLIRGVLHDARQLVREEIALARAELRQEASKARNGAIAIGAAVVAASIGATLLCIALGGAVADAFGWPAWAGYGLVAVLLLVGAYVLVNFAKRRVATVRPLPQTVDSVKENMEWIQKKSGTR